MKNIKRNIEDLYVESAILHHQLLLQGDRKGSKAAHDRLISATKKIRAQQDKGAFFLRGLLNHNDENVRLWAASHLLPLEEAPALRALKHLATNAKSWQVQTSAETTAEEWERGTLDVDWFMNKQQP
jgi:hypothetical protein